MNVMIYFENVPLKITQQSVECLLRTYSKNKTSSQLYNKIRMGKTNILMFGWKKKKKKKKLTKLVTDTSGIIKNFTNIYGL